MEEEEEEEETARRQRRSQRWRRLFASFLLFWEFLIFDGTFRLTMPCHQDGTDRGRAEQNIAVRGSLISVVVVCVHRRRGATPTHNHPDSILYCLFARTILESERHSHTISAHCLCWQKLPLAYDSRPKQFRLVVM